MNKKVNKKIDKKIDKKINKKHSDTYKCQICNRESKNSVDAITHLLDHGSSALEAINALIRDQKVGRVLTSDRARDDRVRTSTDDDMAASKKKKVMSSAQEA